MPPQNSLENNVAKILWPTIKRRKKFTPKDLRIALQRCILLTQNTDIGIGMAEKFDSLWLKKHYQDEINKNVTYGSPESFIKYVTSIIDEIRKEVAQIQTFSRESQKPAGSTPKTPNLEVYDRRTYPLDSLDEYQEDEYQEDEYQEDAEEEPERFFVFFDDEIEPPKELRL